MDAVATSNRAATALLVSAGLSAVSGVIVAFTPPPSSSPIVFLPMVFGLIGTMATGVVMRRALLGCVLVLMMVIGWLVGFVATSGVIPPGLGVAIGIAVTAALYPFDDDATRLILLTCGVAGLLAIPSALLRLQESSGAHVASIVLSIASVAAFFAATVVSVRRQRAGTLATR